MRDDNQDLLKPTHLEHAAAYSGVYSNFCWHNRLSFVEEKFEIEKEYIPQEIVYLQKGVFGLLSIIEKNINILKSNLSEEEEIEKAERVLEGIVGSLPGIVISDDIRKVLYKEIKEFKLEGLKKKHPSLSAYSNEELLRRDEILVKYGIPVNTINLTQNIDYYNDLGLIEKSLSKRFKTDRIKTLAKVYFENKKTIKKKYSRQKYLSRVNKIMQVVQVVEKATGIPEDLSYELQKTLFREAFLNPTKIKITNKILSDTQNTEDYLRMHDRKAVREIAFKIYSKEEIIPDAGISATGRVSARQHAQDNAFVERALRDKEDFGELVIAGHSDEAKKAANAWRKSESRTYEKMLRGAEELLVKKIENIKELPIPVRGIGKVDILKTTIYSNKVVIDAEGRSPPRNFVSHAGVKYMSIYITKEKMDTVETEKELADLLFEELVELAAKINARTKNIDWTPDLAMKVHNYNKMLLERVNLLEENGITVNNANLSMSRDYYDDIIRIRRSLSGSRFKGKYDDRQIKTLIRGYFENKKYLKRQKIEYTRQKFLNRVDKIMQVVETVERSTGIPEELSYELQKTLFREAYLTPTKIRITKKLLTDTNKLEDYLRMHDLDAVRGIAYRIYKQYPGSEAAEALTDETEDDVVIDTEKKPGLKDIKDVEIKEIPEAEKIMQVALEEAQKARKERWYFSARVGAVASIEGEVIGKGYNRKNNELHAEYFAVIDALRNTIAGSTIDSKKKHELLHKLSKAEEISASFQDAETYKRDFARTNQLLKEVNEYLDNILSRVTMYSTLESCPKCAVMYKELGINNAVFGAESRKKEHEGLKILNEAGIKVTLKVLEKRADRLLSGYFLITKYFADLYERLQTVSRYISKRAEDRRRKRLKKKLISNIKIIPNIGDAAITALTEVINSTRWIISSPEKRGPPVDLSEEGTIIIRLHQPYKEKQIKEILNTLYQEIKLEVEVEKDEKERSLDKLKDILQNSTNVTDDLRALADKGELDKLFPGFSGLKEIKTSAGMTRYGHTFDFIKVLERIEKGDLKGFNGEKTGEKIKKNSFTKYSKLFPKNKEERELIYLAALTHDWGSIISAEGHEEKSAGLLKENIPGLGYSSDFANNIAWLAGNHLSMSNVFLGERAPIHLLNSMSFIANEEKDKLMGYLAMVTFCDMGSTAGGKYLTNKKSSFFLEECTESKLIDLQKDLVNWRLTKFVGNGAGESKGREDEINKVYESLEKTVGKEALDNFNKHLGETIEAFDYGLYLFQNLSSENLIKVLLLITQVMELEQRAGNKTNFVQLAFRIDKNLIAEILDDINIEEFSFTNIEKLYDGVKKETTKDLLGLEFKYEDNKLKIDAGKKPEIEEKVTTEEIMEPKTAWEIIFSVNHPLLNRRLPRFIKNFWVSSLQKRIDIAGKYNIEQYEKEGFKVYRITDIKSNSSLDIVPGYSNKIISLVINGEPILYFNEIRASGGMEDMYLFFNRVAGNNFIFEGKIKELGGEDLVKKGFTKKDNAGKGTVYHGMARKKPWKMKIKYDKDGIYTQSVFKNRWYREIRRLFGRGKITVEYRLKGNELHNQKEIDNRTIGSTGSHPWIKIKPGDKWHMLVPADEVSVAKDMIPTGDRIKVEDSSSDPRVNLDLNLKSFKPLEGKWNNVLTGLKL